MALFHHRSLGQWKSISTRGALKLAAANIPFENSSTAFGALHPYGQSNILEIVNTTILVRKSTEKVFEQHRSVFFHKSSCILAIYKDIYIELTKISTAITTQKNPVTRNALSKANSVRDYRIFEEFAFHMVSLAQKRRITRGFELHGRFYAVDSTTIDLCMSMFEWAHFRSTKSGVRIHTQIDIITEIPVFYRITTAKVHDTKAMDWITYEPLACYVFDRGYFDLTRLFAIEQSQAFFIIREKGKPDYEIISGKDLLDGEDNVLRDQTIRFTGKRNKNNYPTELRRIVYYAPELQRSFTYYTNNFYFKANDIALLYRYRWQVELFFKWIKQHLKVKSFWGTSENAVRIQIHVAIITYCLIAIVEHDFKLGRPVVEVMRIMGSALLVKDTIQELFEPLAREQANGNEQQLSIEFTYD